MIFDLFKYIFGELENRNIAYLLSGSYALNIYATPRMTMDIDILINLNKANLPSFFEIFENGYNLNKESIQNDVFARRMFNIIHSETSFKFDFIPKDRSEYSNSQFSRKRYEKIDGFKALIISPEDLLISKLRWIQNTGSDFHLRDLENLIQVQQLDKKYIHNWCDQLNLKTFNLPL